ncbi:hypothetical protein IFU39_00100 [Paenibacillus sp. CFBP 13594]|uniref:hypothetical protein n=1 Tax=Paenibacillus sp. CFBP 13594 TaxID=2774037 RepID=UPI00177BF222|nr:hypothetical protein [Paenibacillus sp. CFBP 13594]MBD8836219.1 hypothetical protein [Paenibacillus sp. CFBP 13594]
MIKLARPVKCRYCNEFSMLDDSMTIVETQHKYAKDKFDSDGKKIRKKGETYSKKNKVHKKCATLFQKKVEETKIENENWDVLCKYIEKLHDLTVIPKSNITRLKDLRAGFETKNGERIRKWRTGPDFSLMLDAYALSELTIKNSLKNKLDGSNDVKSINYCISIMIGKLNEAFVRRRNRERQVQEQKLNKEVTIIEEISYTPKKTNSNDISDFL